MKPWPRMPQSRTVRLAAAVCLLLALLIAGVWAYSGVMHVGPITAEEIALTHAGIDRKKADALRASLRWEDGVFYYDVAFWTDGRAYEYKIQAASGAILEAG